MTIAPLELDCKSCGACCSYRWSWPVLRRDRSDATDIPQHLLRDDFPLMKTINNRCTALDGEVGVSCQCSIYEIRPHACKAFLKGSKLCLEARANKNLNQQ